jgi:hypothetical protein
MREAAEKLMSLECPHCTRRSKIYCGPAPVGEKTTDDLVTRLRVRAEFTGPYSALWDEAADRIEQLEAALRMVIDWDNTLDWEDGPAWGDLMDIARKALEGKDD